MSSTGSFRDDRPASWLSIVAVAAIPAVGLAALWQGADAATPPPTTTTTTTVAPPPREQLTTPLLSVRRHPQPIADERAVAAAAAELSGRVDDLVAAVGDQACLTVVDPDGITGTGERSVVVSHRSDAAMIPASNEKVFTAAVALDVLGPDYRFTTDVRAATPIDGVIGGDLYLIGGGDPLLVTDPTRLGQTYPAFNITSVDELADRVAAAGVTRIEGRVVGDGSRYDDEWRAPSWGDNISSYEGGPTDGLVIDDGFLGESGVAPNPNLAAAETFADELRERGITVVGGATAGTAPPDGVTSVASIDSRPLRDILIELLHSSDNTTAEMLVKELSYVETGVGNRTAGLGVIAGRMSQWGLPIDTLSLQDGSGLSSANQTSCATLAAVLETSPIAAELVSLLPVAGRDGTLAQQLIGTPAEGMMRAKTGTLTDVKALSGVQPDGTGADLVFSLIINGPGANQPDTYQPRWREVSDFIADYPPPITADVAPFEPR